MTEPRNDPYDQDPGQTLYRVEVARWAASCHAALAQIVDLSLGAGEDEVDVEGVRHISTLLWAEAERLERLGTPRG